MTWRADTHTRVVVFAREPRAGRVKTRLIPLLGAHGAARLHARLLRRALALAKDARMGPVEHWTTRRQRGADLGARMLHAFTRSLRRAERVILIGSDCPVLRARDLRLAARWLAGGADAQQGASRAQVMAQTRARLAALGWRWRELPEVWDVDRPEDVARLRRLRLP